jgi:hypothetical protein
MANPSPPPPPPGAPQRQPQQPQQPPQQQYPQHQQQQQQQQQQQNPSPGNTAAGAFHEAKTAVSGASKRAPYPWFALASVGAVVIWLLLPENDKLGAENLKLWTVMVITAALLLMAPMVRSTFKLNAERAWQFCAAGAVGLGFAWVAFLLPAINTNQAFFGTIAAAAAGLAAWTAPGRPPM